MFEGYEELLPRPATGDWTRLGNNNETGGNMTGLERTRIKEIRKRLSGITDGEWKAGVKRSSEVVSVNSTRPPAVHPGLDEIEDYGGVLIGESIICVADGKFIAAAPDDIRFLLDLVERLRARAGECDVDPEVAKLTGRVRLLEGDVSNLKAAVDELRRPTEQARDLIANACDDVQALRTAVEFLMEKRSAQQAKIEELQRRIAEFMR